MKHAYIAFHQLASVVRLSCLYKSTVTNLPLFFLFCSTTISCAEKKFAHFQKAYINFGIFKPYSCSLEGWMHQIFSILTHCSAFKSCCLLQWDTGKALLLNFSSFFFFLSFLNPLLPVFTSWLPHSTCQLAVFDYCWWGEIHQCTSVLHTRCFCFRTLSMSRVHGQVFILFGEKSTEPFFVWCVLVCWSSTTVGYILLLSDCERMPPSKSWIWK